MNVINNTWTNTTTASQQSMSTRHYRYAAETLLQVCFQRISSNTWENKIQSE